MATLDTSASYHRRNCPNLQIGERAMASEEPWENGDGPDPAPGLTPEAVEDTDFATVRRGYEPGPVRNRLREAADEIRRLNALIGSLSARVDQLEATPPETLESRRVAEALGDEATRVLQSASDAARERIGRAEAEHNDIVGKAQAAAAAIVEDSREQGREMVVEARNVRGRILADLARKRREHRIEMEQLRVIHDRFMEAINICRQGLDGWIEELAQAEPQAVAAAELARQRVEAEPEQTVGEIEAEIDAARLVGAPLDREPRRDRVRRGDPRRRRRRTWSSPTRPSRPPTPRRSPRPPPAQTTSSRAGWRILTSWTT